MVEVMFADIENLYPKPYLAEIARQIDFFSSIFLILRHTKKVKRLGVLSLMGDQIDVFRL